VKCGTEHDEQFFPDDHIISDRKLMCIGWHFVYHHHHHHLLIVLIKHILWKKLLPKSLFTNEMDNVRSLPVAKKCTMSGLVVNCQSELLSNFLQQVECCGLFLHKTIFLSFGDRIICRWSEYRYIFVL